MWRVECARNEMLLVQARRTSLTKILTVTLDLANTVPHFHGADGGSERYCAATEMRPVSDVIYLGSKSMILWTIQTEAAVMHLECTGVLRGDGRRIWREHRRAYQWMIGQMKERLKPPLTGSHYPVWAWKIFSAHAPRPDLRFSAHLPAGTRGARIEFEVSEQRVLLSDFERWHFVLSAQFLADDEPEDQAVDHLPLSVGRVEASWARIFELERGDPAYHGTLSDRQVQATLWHVKQSEVRALTWFTAR